jgi:hypothetical protein
MSTCPLFCGCAHSSTSKNKIVMRCNSLIFMIMCFVCLLLSLYEVPTAKSHMTSTASATQKRRKTAIGGSKNTYDLEDLSLLVPKSSLDTLQDDAIRAINQELARTDELHVAVPRLLQSCDNELSEVRKSIHAIVSTQTGEALRSRRVLKEASEKIVKLQSEFVEQGDILSGMQTAACYRQLKQLTVLRANVQRIIKWTEALKAIHHFPFDKSLRSGKFLEIYERLCETQDIRTSVMKKAASDPHASQVFEPYFVKLDSILEIFLMHVQSVFEGSAMIAILHVLGDDDGNESAADESDEDEEGNPIRKFVHLEECIEICSREKSNPCTHKRNGYDAENVLDSKGVANWVKQSVSQTWVDEVMGDVVDSITQMDEYLDSMKKLEQIMVALEMALAPLSTKFPFVSMVIVAFHCEVLTVVRRYADPVEELEATKLLEAIKFLRWYSSFLDECSFLQYLESGTSEIDDIIAQMMKLAVSGMSQHLTHLSDSCAQTTCELEPKALPSGQIFSTGPTDLFTILQQSLGNITTSVETEVSQKLAKACADGVRAYITECKKRMDYDYWEDEKSGGAPSSEWSSRRLNFLYAFCNDLTTIEENLEVLELKFANVWTEDVDETPFQQLRDHIFEDINFYIDEISDHVNRLVSEEWKKLFVSSSWQSADSNPLRAILDTMADFMDEEFSVVIHDAHAKVLTKSMMMDSFRRYLSELFRYFKETQNSKWKPTDAEIFHAALARDATELHSFWAGRTISTRTQFVDQGRQAIDVLADLMRYIAGERTDLFERVLRGRLIENFGDCPSFVITYIIEKRSDVDSKTKARLSAIWNDLIKSQHRENDVAVNWKQGSTFLGGISRDFAPESKSFFSKKKKPKEDEAAQRSRVKDEKRKAREDEKLQKRSKKKAPSAAPSNQSKEVGVESLADLLGH